MPFPEDPIEVYQQGQQVTLFVDFLDVAGAAADPEDSVTLKYIEGDGNPVEILQAGLNNPSIGRWEFQLQIPRNGNKAVKPWVYRFEGISTTVTIVNADDERRFEVAASPLYPPS